MIAGLRPYPAYRDSGVEWLGDLPAHWSVHRLRDLCELRVSNVDKHSRPDEQPVRLCNYVDVYKNDHIRSGLPFMQATATADEIERFRLQIGDVLITKDSETWNDIGVPAVVREADADMICGYHLALLRPHRDAVQGDLLFRSLQSHPITHQFHVAANGITRYGLSHGAIKSVRLPVAPVSEQAAMARFLDHADQRIQRAIGAREKRIALLEEQKGAIIHRIVTGQVDVRTGKPYAAYKGSGVAELGRVPDHWKTVRLGRLMALQTGFPFKSEGFTRNSRDPRLLRGVNIAPGRLRWDDTVRWPATEADAPALCDYRLQAGDIVLGMDRPVIQGGTRVAVVTEADLPSLLLREARWGIRPGPELRRDFALLLLSGKPFADYMAPIFTGISVPHLSPEQIRGFTVALPCLGEQDQILEALARQISAFQRAADRARRQINHMKEYRTRLIADVVTGKLDVREAAAALPDAAPA